jgi:hypothetical protein
MTASRLPLPLELSKPVLLAADLDSQLRSDYDPKTQLCSNTRSTQTSSSVNGAGVQVDVAADIAIDDVIA